MILMNFGIAVVFLVLAIIWISNGSLLPQVVDVLESKGKTVDEILETVNAEHVKAGLAPVELKDIKKHMKNPQQKSNPEQKSKHRKGSDSASYSKLS